MEDQKDTARDWLLRRGERLLDSVLAYTVTGAAALFVVWMNDLGGDSMIMIVNDLLVIAAILGIVVLALWYNKRSRSQHVPLDDVVEEIAAPYHSDGDDMGSEGMFPEQGVIDTAVLLARLDKIALFGYRLNTVPDVIVIGTHGERVPPDFWATALISWGQALVNDAELRSQGIQTPDARAEVEDFHHFTLTRRDATTVKRRYRALKHALEKQSPADGRPSP